MSEKKGADIIRAASAIAEDELAMIERGHKLLGERRWTTPVRVIESSTPIASQDMPAQPRETESEE